MQSLEVITTLQLIYIHMLNLTNPNTSYILFSPENDSLSNSENKSNFEKACSILYSKDYTILEVLGHYKGLNERSILAFPNKDDNDSVRMDGLYLLEIFHQDSIIIKYNKTPKATKILSDGSEKPLGVILYDSDLENKTYLYDGLSFSFIEEKMYYFPKLKSELKEGMIVEYLNENTWKKKQISNLDLEYESLYKLLIKYNKLRFEYN
jgi:hypothetical protein